MNFRRILKCEPGGILRYIGVDLAWGEKGTTGLAVLNDGGHLIESSLATGLDEIIEFVLKHAGDDCLVGIDAPLVVKNETGHRPCETELAKRRIPAYPANRKLLAGSNGTVRGEVMVDRLKDGNFTLTDEHPESLDGGRFIHEVYPWSILHYHCYDPETKKSLTPRYKPKRGLKVDDIREGTVGVRDLIGRLKPPVILDYSRLVYPVGDRDILQYRGKKLKAVGDIFDGILCAYAVYSVHILGRAGGEIIGDLETGYILVPPDVRSIGV